MLESLCNGLEICVFEDHMGLARKEMSFRPTNIRQLYAFWGDRW